MQTYKQQTQTKPMEITFQFPDELGQEIQEQTNSNEFMVKAAEKALLEKWQDEQTEIALAQVERGEVVSHEEVKKRLAKYIL